MHSGALNSLDGTLAAKNKEMCVQDMVQSLVFLKDLKKRMLSDL